MENGSVTEKRRKEKAKGGKKASVTAKQRRECYRIALLKRVAKGEAEQE